MCSEKPEKLSIIQTPDCLTIYPLPNDIFLDWSKIASIYRQQNKFYVKAEILFGMGRKHLGKSRKWWLPAFSPFPTVFSKGFFFRVVKSRNCLVKG